MFSPATVYYEMPDSYYPIFRSAPKLLLAGWLLTPVTNPNLTIMVAGTTPEDERDFGVEGNG